MKNMVVLFDTNIIMDVLENASHFMIHPNPLWKAAFPAMSRDILPCIPYQTFFIF